VDPPAQELQVVGQDEEHADEDEGHEARADLGHPHDAEGDRPQEPEAGREGEAGARDRGAQRAAVKLVEGVGADADGEEERAQSGQKARCVEGWSERRADHHVGEVPRCVGGVEDRPPVPPAAGPGRVVGGPGLSLLHASSPT
jgi:hypothetical protein